MQRHGAYTCLDHRKNDHLAECTNKFDVILEMLANINLGADLKCLKKGGIVAVVGSRGPAEVNPRDLMSRDASIVGVSLANCSPSDKYAIAAKLFPLLVEGKLQPVVRKTYSLNDLARAHDDVLQPGALGNLVISIDEA